ncbi:MAG: 50S ribosomal protein L18 [Deltaproteobacteria bacterium]|nr:50S ribosomal protein L18 [Deltaproteobacteria bacterium]
MKRKIKNEGLARRARRATKIRHKVEGTSARPRLAVYRSAVHIYAQLVDDIAGQTLAAVSTVTKTLRDEVKDLKKSEQAERVGKALAEAAKAKGIESVVFDRKGWPYHGRIAALARGARAGGLQF